MMKKLLPLALLLLCACTHVYKNPEIVIKQNRAYDNTGKLMDGKEESYHTNGQLRYTTRYKAGIETGHWESFGYKKDLLQSGEYTQSIELATLAAKQYPVDYALLNKWEEGDKKFITASIYLQKPVDSVKKETMAAYIKYLDQFGIPNKEVLVVCNENVLGTLRDWR